MLSLLSVNYSFHIHFTGKILPWAEIGLWAQALCKAKKSRWFYDSNWILFRAPIWKGIGIARLKMRCYQCKVIIFIYNILLVSISKHGVTSAWMHVVFENQVKEEWLLLPGTITAFILGDILRKEGYSSLLSSGNNLKDKNTSTEEANACNE